jgi:hypothetical protein
VNKITPPQGSDLWGAESPSELSGGPTGPATNGRPAIVEHIGEVFAQFVGASGHRFRRAGTTGHHQSLLIRWELTGGGQQVAGTGLNVLILGPDGRIGADYQFSEPQPAGEAGAGGR